MRDAESDLGGLILTELPAMGFILSSLGEVRKDEWIAVLDAGRAGVFVSREAKATPTLAIESALVAAKVPRQRA